MIFVLFWGLGVFCQTANLLWRIKHGEMPKGLDPKVWWILIGTNDLVTGECSEEAVVLGILRLADEIAMTHPGSVVVIQGLLPRTNNMDGTLTHAMLRSVDFNNTRNRALARKGNRTWIARPGHAKPATIYVRPQEYPLWPSIQLINSELERFCAKHKHMVYFDAASIFTGSMGNQHYQSQSKVILQELMPDYAHLSFKGHEILLKVIAKELNRIIYENDETNHKAQDDRHI